MFLLLLFSSIIPAVAALPAGGGHHGMATSSTNTSPVAIVPHTNPSSQYHAQDELGQYSYGYTNADGISKAEVKGIDGSIAGKYSYIDANGKRVEVSYIADDSGFRATGDNLPSNEVPHVPSHLAQAYLEANTRLNNAYILNQAQANHNKENQGKEEEEEEEGKSEKGGSEGSEEEEEENEEEEKKPETDNAVNTAPSTTSAVHPPVSISSPVLIGQVHGYQQAVVAGAGQYASHPQPATSPQLVYLARAVVNQPAATMPHHQVAPVPVKNSVAAPVVTQGATIRLIHAAPVRTTDYAFHTYVPALQQQHSNTQNQKGVVHHNVQVPIHHYNGQVLQSQSQYVPQIALAPGYGYIQAQYSGYQA